MPIQKQTQVTSLGMLLGLCRENIMQPRIEKKAEVEVEHEDGMGNGWDFGILESVDFKDGLVRVKINGVLGRKNYFVAVDGWKLIGPFELYA